jgi:hypothetical protein
MTLNEFHVLRAASPRRSTAWFAVRRGGNLNGAYYFALLKGTQGANAPAQLDVVEGRSMTDLIGNDASLVIVSKTVKELLIASKFTGWREYPVRLYGRNGAPINAEYTGLSIVGRAGYYDRERSVTKWQVGKDGSRTISSMNGIYFDPGEWDGSDLFVFKDEDSRLVLATTRLINALKGIQATGWISCPVLEYRMGSQVL